MEHADIEDIIKPYGIFDLDQAALNNVYNLLDKYYLTNLDSTNIKNEFIKYQLNIKKFKLLKSDYLLYFYLLARNNGRYKFSDIALEKNLKVNSGISVIVSTIFTSGYPSYTVFDKISNTEKIVYDFTTDPNKKNSGAFSCGNNCHYCPNVPDQPRSYYPGEPGVDRAIQNDYDAIKQCRARALQYIQKGLPIDKFEIITKGGTWDWYSENYRRQFARDIYYAHNTLIDYIFGKEIRKPYSLAEEIKINESASCRIIGITVETRPDHVNYKTIQFLREIGATRVELGIQHLDDNILRYVNRGCYKKHSIRAIKMLKDVGFKVDAHLMLDLPAPLNIPGYENKMPQIDKAMLEEFNSDQLFKVDQIKIYPCMVMPYTEIEKWYKNGTYKPYGEDEVMTPEEKINFKKLSTEDKINIRKQNPLYKNIFEFCQNIHPSVRINRIIRDLPTTQVCGGTKRSGMRGEIDRDFDYLGLVSNDIRFREAGNYRNIDNSIDHSIDQKPELIIREFYSSDGIEFFLSFETKTKNPILYSFLRLRLSSNSGKTDTGKIIFPELIDCALIRELHTYGKVVPCTKNNHLYTDNKILLSQDNQVQHKGYGKELINIAEDIALNNNYKKIAVIAGVGVREYYRKQGYIHDTKEGCYQFKYLSKEKFDYKKKINLNKNDVSFGLTLLFVLGFIGLFYFIVFAGNYIVYKFNK
jgi:histone acetyltransferase (RNA polymerase elongator complex component)